MDATPSSDERETRGAKRMLTILMVAFAFSYADLALVMTLCEAVKKEFALADWQTGLLCGSSFALTFALFGLYRGWISDRSNRRWIITFSLAMWGGLTIACGFAWNFWQLLGARIGVSLGQSGITPPAHSIISNYRPAGRRSRAMGVYGAGIPLGAALGALAGAWITQDYGWRVACFALGAPGIIMAILFRLIVRKGSPRPTAQDVEEDPIEMHKLTRARTPSFVHIVMGLAITAFIGFAYLQFTLPLLKRNFDLDYIQAGALAALINGLGGALGIYSGGRIAQNLAVRDIRIQSRLPAIGCIFAAGFYCFAMLQTNLFVLAALMFCGALAHGLHFAPSFASIQDIAPPQKRATASAWAMFFVGIVGLGLGPLGLGAFSDYLAANNFEPPLMYHGLDFATACATRIIAGNEQACATASASGLKQGMLLIVPVYFWAAAHFARASHFIRQDTGLTLPEHHEDDGHHPNA